jgi:7-cyano-7-deazaguanosine (preQ0) biosynthesis protein QueE
MNQKISVSEIFGPTIQGEGKNLGKPSMFLRLAKCNLKCTWCDTKYTWDWENYDPKKEIKYMTIGDISKELETKTMKLDPKSLVITGGEPMLQQKKLSPLFQYLPNWFIEIETAGTIKPEILPDQFNVSLKLENSENPLRKRYKPDVIESFIGTNRCIWKFVVEKVEDFEEIDRLVERFGLSPVYIMPEGVEPEKVRQTALEILPYVVERNWILTPRYHIDLWSNKRGV